MEGVMGTMVLTKVKAAVMALVVGCAVTVTAAVGWRANTAGAADPPKPETSRPTARNPDKERIAELEREREELKRELAAFRAEAEALQRYVIRTHEIFRVGGFPVGSPAQLAPASPAPGPGPAPAEAPGPHTPKSTAPPAATASPDQTGTANKGIVRVYPVADLVTVEADGEALVRVVRKTVDPKSWSADASVEYLPGRKVLVVRQSAPAHKEVAELLHLLQPQGSRPTPPREQK
jgi:hypothetical protein